MTTFTLHTEADCTWAERKGRKLNTLIICGTFRKQKKTYTGRAAAPITNCEIGERGHFTFVFLLSTKWQYVIPVAITAMNGFFHSQVHKSFEGLRELIPILKPAICAEERPCKLLSAISRTSRILGGNIVYV